MDIIMCELCKYWNKLSAAPSKGECRINPPRPKANSGNFTGQLNTFWSITKGDDWCGSGKVRISESIDPDE